MSKTKFQIDDRIKHKVFGLGSVVCVNSFGTLVCEFDCGTRLTCANLDDFSLVHSSRIRPPQVGDEYRENAGAVSRWVSRTADVGCGKPPEGINRVEYNKPYRFQDGDRVRCGIFEFTVVRPHEENGDWWFWGRDYSNGSPNDCLDEKATWWQAPGFELIAKASDEICTPHLWDDDECVACGISQYIYIGKNKPGCGKLGVFPWRNWQFFQDFLRALHTPELVCVECGCGPATIYAHKNLPYCFYCICRLDRMKLRDTKERETAVGIIALPISAGPHEGASAWASADYESDW